MSLTSIIIIVKNDRKIGILLDKLCAIKSSLQKEILVVDASEGKLDDIKERFPDVNWIRFINKIKKKTTIPEQRNMGIKHARGDVIVFIDSDCIPDDNWLIELIKPIKEDSEKIVAGRVQVEDSNSPHELAFSKKIDNKYLDECPTMNVAYIKEIFNHIGYFDEKLLFGSDVDLAWRAVKSGLKIRLNKNAIIYHDLGNSKNDFRRMYDYGKARYRLYKKHTYRWKTFLGNELLFILYPLYVILLPLTFIFPLYPLFILYPLIKYRKYNPYQLLPLKTAYGIGILKEIISF